MFTWIYRNPDADPTAGDEPPVEDATPTELDDHSADSLAELEAEDASEQAEEQPADEDQELGDDEVASLVAELAPVTQTTHGKDEPEDDAFKDVPATIVDFVTKAPALDLTVYDAALKSIQEDADSNELPEGTARALAAVVAQSKALAEAENTRRRMVQRDQAKVTREAEKRAASDRQALDAMMTEIGVPASVKIREAILDEAQAMLPELQKKLKPGQRVSAKSILAAARARVLNAPAAAPKTTTTAKAPPKPTGAIRSTAPAAQPKPTKSKATVSTFAATQAALNGSV